MKLKSRTMLATVAVAVAALGSTATAEANPSLSIGYTPYTAPYASGGSVQIVDHCINRNYYWYGQYRVYGAYCVSYAWWSLRTYYYTDQWGRQWALDCWSNPIESRPCSWR